MSILLVSSGPGWGVCNWSWRGAHSGSSPLHCFHFSWLVWEGAASSGLPWLWAEGREIVLHLVVSVGPRRGITWCYTESISTNWLQSGTLLFTDSVTSMPLLQHSWPQLEENVKVCQVCVCVCAYVCALEYIRMCSQKDTQPYWCTDGGKIFGSLSFPSFWPLHEPANKHIWYEISLLNTHLTTLHVATDPRAQLEKSSCFQRCQSVYSPTNKEKIQPDSRK